MGMKLGRRRARRHADRRRTTREGDDVPIKLLRTQDGAVRSLWLFESPRMLRELFEENRPQVGDFLMVRRYPKRKIQDGERSYWPFALARVPASPGDTDGTTVAPPDDGGDTQAALEAERAERDAGLSEHDRPRF